MSRAFTTEAEADQSADLRNNAIGRAIGSSSEPRKMSELATLVLAHFRKHGLWLAEPTETGTWQIEQRKISDATYATATERLRHLDEDGFGPAQKTEPDR